MAVAGGSNIGQRRDNEDSYYMNVEKGIFVIADGMGGHENGQLASKTAVANIVEQALALEGEALSIARLEQMFQQANDVVYQYQEALHEGIMGTTLTVVLVQAHNMYIGHIGDSRLYLVRDGEIIQLTLDHSYYAELMRLGKFEAEIRKENQRNMLLRALGPEEKIEGQYVQEEIRYGDLLILCTDGLYNCVAPEELQAVTEANMDLSQAVQDLLNLALEREARDNLTVVLYRHESR